MSQDKYKYESRCFARTDELDKWLNNMQVYDEDLKIVGYAACDDSALVKANGELQTESSSSVYVTIRYLVG